MRAAKGVYCIQTDGNYLLIYCMAGSCMSRFGRVGVLSWQTSNGALSISVTNRKGDTSVCVWWGGGDPCGFNYCSIVAVLSSWRRPGFDVGLIPRDSWMLGWSGLLMQTSHCYPHFLSGKAVWNESCCVHACVSVCLSCHIAVWMGTESRLCVRHCLGSSWSPGNLEEMSATSQNANMCANISCMQEK